jgi:hypothetical protein
MTAAESNRFSPWVGRGRGGSESLRCDEQLGAGA